MKQQTNKRTLTRKEKLTLCYHFAYDLCISLMNGTITIDNLTDEEKQLVRVLANLFCSMANKINK